MQELRIQAGNTASGGESLEDEAKLERMIKCFRAARRVVEPQGAVYMTSYAIIAVELYRDGYGIE